MVSNSVVIVTVALQMEILPPSDLWGKYQVVVVGLLVIVIVAGAFYSLY